MTHQPDISVIITAHAERLFAGVSAKSALAAVNVAEQNGLSCEFIVVLDNADETTARILRNTITNNAVFLETSEGDPGLARNRGVQAANGIYTCFLDADDLWSENWLVAASQFLKEFPNVVGHSACNIDFGDQDRLWWHPDSISSLCDLSYLEWMNYWDALSFARTDIYRQYPFQKNAIKLGYGHEDWHWNKITIAAGIQHRPVPGTIHFKRKRGGSQSRVVENRGGLPWPTATPDRRMLT